MANNTAVAFLEKVISDKALKARVTNIDQAVAVAAELGFTVTREELLAAEQELRAESGADVEELDEAEMDLAAGGANWEGEDAPDGHEMGCRLFYHEYSYSKETGNWCQGKFYHQPTNLCKSLYEH